MFHVEHKIKKKMVKITVTGFVNEVFIGTDEQAEKYLQNLKKLQESNCDIKEYRKMMPIDKHPYIDQRNAKGFYPAQWRVIKAVERYSNPTDNLIAHRQKMQPFGLKIKIEKADTLPL